MKKVFLFILMLGICGIVFAAPKRTLEDNDGTPVGTTANPLIARISGEPIFTSSCFTLTSPDTSLSQCCIDNSDTLTCTGL